MRTHRRPTPVRLLPIALVLFVAVAGDSPATAQVSDAPSSILERIRYRSIGPTKQGGRIMDIGVPDLAKQPYTFYAAASTGGLWKTTDNGLTWAPIFDDVPINSIGDIAVAHSDPDVIYVGNGNGSYWGEGVYKTTDGGDTWVDMGLGDSLYIPRIRVHPDDADTVYVAAAGNWVTESAERGVFKSSDGGESWTRSLALTHAGHNVGAADLVMDPRDSDVLYASAWDREDGGGSGIYKTTDGGDSWNKLEGNLPDPERSAMDRIGLDVHYANPDIVVASILLADPEWDGSDSYSRFQNSAWRSSNAGATWTRIDPGHDTFNLKGASRFGQIRVDTQNPDRIFVLNTGVQGTPDGGATWQKMIRFAGDNQSMWINPDNADHIILGYDYGLAVSFSGGETWYHPDNLPLGQLEGLGVDMARPYNVYGGMQDFGTWRGPSTKRGRWPIRFEDWEHVSGADGSYAQIDPSDNRWLYVESQNGSISRNDQLTGMRKRIRYCREGIRFNFIAPILLSPHNPNVLYHGANVLLRSRWRGEGWEEISPDLSEGGAEVDPNGRDTNGTINTLDASPVDAGILWAGTDNGNLWVSRDDGDNWSILNDNVPGWPDHKVTRVEASNHAAGTAYVSASGGRRNRSDLKPYVYRTNDFGQTWSAITNGLPADEPVTTIREDHRNPNLLFVGTAKAVYVSLDRGDSWTSLRNNMPNVPIHDLVIHPRDNDLVVATYGRSFWIADIGPLQELTADVLASDAHLFDVEPSVLWISSRQNQVASIYQNYEGENAPFGTVVNYWLREPANSVRVQIYRGTRLVDEYAGPTDAGLNSVEWSLTERTPRTDEEKTDWDDWYEGVTTEEEYFDYYDGTDHFGEADDEVSVFGRPLGVWVHTLPNERERDYKHLRATPGVYTVRLIVDGNALEGAVEVLADTEYSKIY